MNEATLRGTLRPQTIHGIPVPGSYTGITEHSELNGRDAADQHPMSAITGLSSALAAKGTYSKPSGGIPASDLAAAVQTSLGKADSALQDMPTAEEVEYDPNETHTAGSVAEALSSQSDNIENLKFSTILIDSQGKFYVKQEDD